MRVPAPGPRRRGRQRTLLDVAALLVADRRASAAEAAQGLRARRVSPRPPGKPYKTRITNEGVRAQSPRHLQLRRAPGPPGRSAGVADQRAGNVAAPRRSGRPCRYSHPAQPRSDLLRPAGPCSLPRHFISPSLAETLGSRRPPAHAVGHRTLPLHRSRSRRSASPATGPHASVDGPVRAGRPPRGGTRSGERVHRSSHRPAHKKKRRIKRRKKKKRSARDSQVHLLFSCRRTVRPGTLQIGNHLRSLHNTRSGGGGGGGWGGGGGGVFSYSEPRCLRQISCRGLLPSHFRPPWGRRLGGVHLAARSGGRPLAVKVLRASAGARPPRARRLALREFDTCAGSAARSPDVAPACRCDVGPAQPEYTIACSSPRTSCARARQSSQVAPAECRGSRCR